MEIEEEEEQQQKSDDKEQRIMIAKLKVSKISYKYSLNEKRMNNSLKLSSPKQFTLFGKRNPNFEKRFKECIEGKRDWECKRLSQYRRTLRYRFGRLIEVIKRMIYGVRLLKMKIKKLPTFTKNKFEDYFTITNNQTIH